MLQTRTVEPRTLELLKQLMLLPEIEPFYLVGGTALALQFGHRISIDLDFFTIESFKKNELINLLEKRFTISIESEGKQMLMTYINKIKVDFVKMAYPILYPPVEVEGIRMLDLRDIAPMKLKAVVQRGSKKDFFDIYFLLQQMSITELIELFKKKFQLQEIFHVIKSLTYFEDAEANPDPLVFDKKITWTKVKNQIIKEVNNLI